MSHPLFSASETASSVGSSGRVSRFAPRAGVADTGLGVAPGREPEPGPRIAVLITACRDIAATVRCYRTVLPLATVFLYGSDLLPETVDAADRAGATVVRVPPCDRKALVRRMLAEVDADIYILAHGAVPEDACVAPLIVAEIDTRERDLVDVMRFGASTAEDAGDRLLSRTVDFLFGQGGEMLGSDSKACSRRFALSYRSAGSGADRRHSSALDLALHALRLRLPVGSVASLGGAFPARQAPPVRTVSGWVALLGLIGRLLIEERPRRVLGLVGLGLMAAGIAAALPAVTIHDWHASLPLFRSTLLPMSLLVAGAATGAIGAALDSLAAARQEVKRLGVEAIPRRAERAGPQSSVS